MMMHLAGYSIGVAAALAVVGACVERIAGLQRQPRRTAWIVVMVLSVLVPAVMVVMAKPATTEPVPVPAMEYSAPAAPAAAEVTQPATALPPAPFVNRASPAAPQPSRWSLPAPTDGQLLLMWLLMSGAVALYLCSAHLLLRQRAASWQPAQVLGHDVLISEVTGPALLGLLRPRVVVPRWVQSQPPAAQSLILEHERQHMCARDQLLILSGWLLIMVVPWSPPLWWQWRRLRQAIELDCDARVMREGIEASSYAQVLLAVVRRASGIPAGALAMNEPVHALERRIAALIPEAVRFARLKMSAALVLAVMGAGVALALEAPALQANAPASVQATSLPRPVELTPVPVAAPMVAAAAAAPTAGAAAAQSPVPAAAPATEPPLPRSPRAAPGPAAPATPPAQSASEPVSFMVRVLSPVAEPRRSTFFVRPMQSTPADVPDAVARSRLDEYFNILTANLRAVPGLIVITERDPGIPGVPFEIAISLGDEGRGVSIEARTMFEPRETRVSWMSTDALPRITPRLTALWNEMPEENPDRDMEQLVERLRLTLFPPDREFLDTKLSQLLDPRLESSQRQYVFTQLLEADRRRDPLPVNFQQRTYQPDPAFLAAATQVATTARDPLLRLQIWSALAAIGIPRVDPATLAGPAGRALENEADIRVQFALVNILGLNPQDGLARATLRAVARTEAGRARPEPVRMAARRWLEGDTGWNQYFAGALVDPRMPDAERLELISYAYSGTFMLGEARLRLDQAAERSLVTLLRRQGSPEVANAAVSLLQIAGGEIAREEFISILRAGLGQPAADNRLRRSALSALALSLRIRPELRPLFEDVMARDPDPAMRAGARQALDQTK